MEKRSRFAGRLMVLLLALWMIIQPVSAQETITALADRLQCTQEALLENEVFTPGDSVSDWIAIAAARSGDAVRTKAYRKALTDYVTKKYRREGGLDTICATEWQRISLTIEALGGDPTAVGKDGINLIADGTYDWKTAESLGTQGLNGWIFALIALDSARFAVPENAAYSREDMLTAILSAQEDGGGFGLTTGSADVDITAMALQALAPYRNGTVSYPLASGKTTTVNDAVERALQWLSQQQTSDGDFLSWGSPNAESTAQVIIALCALGIDPAADTRFCKNGASAADGLLRYQLESGMFSHVISLGEDLMATQQAILAQEAMQCLASGSRSLYDFRAPMDAAVRAEITALDAELRHGDITAEQADGLYERYLALPAEERSYVFAYDRLRQALLENGRTLTPENPADAYNLRQPAQVEPSGAADIVWICVAAGTVAGICLILWMRKRKCTK